MRCFSLKEFLILFSVWHVSEQMKDFLENIQLSDDNTFELNSFLEDVLKIKKSFKVIRNAAADMDQDDESISRYQRDEDVNEYIYDEENLEATKRRSNLGKKHENNNKISYLHKADRPSNDIYPHIYGDRADVELKYSDKNINQDNGVRFRRQLVEDVQIEPKSSKGNIDVQGKKSCMTDSSSNTKTEQNDAQEGLRTILSEFIRVTLPFQDDVSITNRLIPEVTKIPDLQRTSSGHENTFFITNPSKQEEPKFMSSSSSVKPEHRDEKKKNLKIKILDDGKIVKGYASNVKEKESSSMNDLSSGSTISIKDIPSADVQYGFTPKMDEKICSKNFGSVLKTDPQHFEKFESMETPSEKSEIDENLSLKGMKKQPKFVGNAKYEMSNKYKHTTPKNIFSHSYDNFDYSQEIDPMYLYVPNKKFYQDEYNVPYSTNDNLRPQQKTFRVESDQKNFADYPAGDVYYHLRRLKTLNETFQNVNRKKRNIKEFLGLDHEDDYTEDLDFSTQVSVRSKILEDEEEYVAKGPYYKSTVSNYENLKTSYLKDPHSSIESSNVYNSVGITAIPIRTVQYDSPEKVKQNIKMKRARKYRTLRKREKRARMRSKSKPTVEIDKNISSKTNYDQLKILRRNQEEGLLEYGKKVSNKIKQGKKKFYDIKSIKRCAVHEKINEKSINRKNEDDSANAFPTLTTYMNDNNHYLKSLRVSTLEGKKADNMRTKENVYQFHIKPKSNQWYKRGGYYQFVPFIPLQSYFQKECPTSVHFEDANSGKKIENFGKQKNLHNSQKKKRCSFNSRKLMTESNCEKHRHDKNKRDIINSEENENESKRYKQPFEKRSESDYGEEPDLSEGQPIKKHSKLKMYNKVVAPVKNFEDNYEFEEITQESSGFPESKKNHIGKNRKHNSQLKQGNDQARELSLKDRLTKLKNKLFSSESDKIKKAVHDEEYYSDIDDYSNRIERQPEQAPMSYAHKQMLNSVMGIDSKCNIKPVDSSVSYCCPSFPASQDPYMRAPDVSSGPCSTHSCHWHFNPLSGTYEASCCPCDPCAVPNDSTPCTCPCDPPTPCDPCPCPPTCNPCSSIVTSSSNDREEADLHVEERSLHSNTKTDSPCICDLCPCPCPTPPGECCPPPCPCEPCPCPSPCPCPCIIPSSMEEEKVNEKVQTQNPSDLVLRTPEASDTGNNVVRIGNNNNVPTSEHFSPKTPYSQHKQLRSHSCPLPRESLASPDALIGHNILNFPEIKTSSEIRGESLYPSYDARSHQDLNICPYSFDNNIYQYLPDLKNGASAAKLQEHDKETDFDIQNYNENRISAFEYPYSDEFPYPQSNPINHACPFPCYCPYPLISNKNGKIIRNPSLTKRADNLENPQQFELRSQVPSSSSNTCPCVLGYFFPLPRLSSSPNLHSHSNNIDSDADEEEHRSINSIPWIDPDVSPNVGDLYARPLSYSQQGQLQNEKSYLACRPSMPSPNVFSSQSDASIQEDSPDSLNVAGVIDGGSKSSYQVSKNNRRSIPRELHGVRPYKYENIMQSYPDNLEGQKYEDSYIKSSDSFPSENLETPSAKLKISSTHSNIQRPTLNMYPCQSYGIPTGCRNEDLQPIIIVPSPISTSDYNLLGKKDRKGKRKCPRPSKSHPPCAAYPIPCSKQDAHMNDDILEEKARRVNEYLKNKFLSGRYSMNNLMFPRSKRQSPLFDNSPISNSGDVKVGIRRVRRPHGIPRKPSNRKMPHELEEKRDKMKHVNNVREDESTEFIIPYLDNENEINQFEEKELHPIKYRKSRSFLNEESDHKKRKSENSKDVKKKNEIEFQDMHFAKEIIDKVMNKVNKNPNLKIKIGNALNKKKIYEAESSQRNAKDSNCEDQAERKEAKHLLSSVSCVLNNLVKKQIEEKLCERLPSHLKNFLKRIVRPTGHRIKQRCDDKYHEDTFLFRASYLPTKLDANAKNQLEDDLEKLLNRYNQLDDESKKKAAPVRSYIVTHLDMLKNIGDDINTPNSQSDHDNSKKINEHGFRNTRNNDKNIDFQSPVKFEGSSDNQDAMERDLDNLELDKAIAPFERVDMGGSTISKYNEEEFEAKFNKRDTMHDSSKSLIKNKGVKKKTKIVNNKVSDKYKKLVQAAEEIRCKRKNEERIGEAFGKRKIGDIRDSPRSQLIIR